MQVRRMLNIATTAICAIILLAVTVWLVVRWNTIPAQIPTNYDISGNITDYSGKGSLIVLHLINWGTFLFMTWMSFRPIEKGGAASFVRMRGMRVGRISSGNLSEKAFAKNPVGANNIAIDMIMGMKLAFTVLLSWIMVTSGAEKPVAAWAMPVAMAVIMIPVVIHIIRFVRIVRS